MKIPMAGKMVNINTTLQLYCTCNFYLATQVYHGYMSCRSPVLVTNKLYCSNCGVFYYEGEVTTCFFSPVFPSKELQLQFIIISLCLITKLDCILHTLCILNIMLYQFTYYLLSNSCINSQCNVGHK